MLLQRERESNTFKMAAGVVVSSASAETLRSLVDLNGQFLELLAEQALVQRAQTSLQLRHLGELWCSLDAEARRRAASCPYLLVDLGFSDPCRWRHPGQELLPATYAGFFTAPRAPAVARLVFIYSWHLSQSDISSAQLILGMSRQCVDLIGSCTLPTMHELAERHPEWMRPRWWNRVRFWRELLRSAASGEAEAMEGARMHGVQLLAADTRAGPTQAFDQVGQSEASRTAVGR